MPNNESVGKKIVEALKKQAENMDVVENEQENFMSSPIAEQDDVFSSDSLNDDIFAETPAQNTSSNFFDEIDDAKDTFFADATPVNMQSAEPAEAFEMPANITVLKKLISQLPSGVSRHTGAQIIKQTMEALGISMKSVLQDAQQVQENLKVSARESQAAIQEYKKQILALEKQSQGYQKQYSALNDLISLFIQTTK